MRTKKPVPEAGDRCLDARVPTGLDRQVALGIEAEGAVGQVGRADAGERLVNNTDFRVNEDWAGRHAVQHWIHEAETAEPVTFLQTLHESMATHSTRPLCLPDVTLRWPDAEHLGSVFLMQAITEGVGDARRGEILVFNIDGPPRGSDRVEKEGLDLPYLGATRISGLAPGDGDVDIRDIG